MQTPSRRISIAAFVVATLAVACSFFFVTNRTRNAASNKTTPELKTKHAKNAGFVSPASKQDWLKAYGNLPLYFEANEGQSTTGIQFISRGQGYDLSLMSQEADLTLRQSNPKQGASVGRAKWFRSHDRSRGTEQVSVLRMHLAGSNPSAAMTGEDRTATKVNYFIGNDARKWHTDVPAYAKVKYSAVYSGVDLVFYGNQRELEYDFVVAPGADAKAIALNIEGASKMRIDARGNLLMSAGTGTIELKKPDAYQEVNGTRREIAGNYAIGTDHEVRFALADYDRTQPLTIDPVVTYSTYVGGSGNASGGDAASGIALDGAGDAYIAGFTSSADLVQVNGVDGVPGAVTSGGSTAFVAELNPTGTAALYLTYLGGSTLDGADAIAVDGGGNIYLTGFTESADFPLSTTNTPSQGIPPGSINNNGAAFITRLNPTLTGNAQLVYSGYLGGSGSVNGGDEGFGIAVDGSGNAFIAGATFSPDFPTQNVVAPFTATLSSPLSNAFLMEINTGGSGTASVLFSGYFGGTGAGDGTNFPFGDVAFGIALDSSSNAYIVGTTTSGASFPTMGTAVSSCTKNTHSAAFVAQVSLATPTAAALTYSSCLAGSTAEVGNAIALGPNNLAYLTGSTGSTDFPVTTNTIPLGFPGPPPGGVPNFNSPVAFVSTVNTTTGALGYSTLLGGNNGEVGFAIATDSQGVAYVAGQTGSSDFPVTQGALQVASTNSMGNAFISKINASSGGNGAADLLYSTYFAGTGDGVDPDAAEGIAVAGTNAYVAGQATTGLATSAGAYQAATKNAAGTNAFVADLPLVPTLSVTPPLLAFGTQLLNTPTAAMTATLTNNSTGSLAIPFTVVGANAGDFAAASGAANGCTGTLAAGATCTIDVIFTPTLVPAGAESATLQIANTAAPAQPFTVALTGTGSATGDFSISAPANFNLTSGMAGSIPVTITGLQGFSGMVNLSCTGLSANVSSCTIPASANTGDTVNASVTATATFVMPPDAIKTPPTATIRQVVFLILGIATLFMIPMTQRRRTRLGMVAAMLVFVAVAGCSGSPSHPTSGSITISGTGTGATAGITHTATVALSISK